MKKVLVLVGILVALCAVRSEAINVLDNNNGIFAIPEGIQIQPIYPNVVLTPQQVWEIVWARLNKRSELGPKRIKSEIESEIELVSTSLNKTSPELQKLIYQAYTGNDEILLQEIRENPLVDITVVSENKSTEKELKKIENDLRQLGYEIVEVKRVEEPKKGVITRVVITVSLIGNSSSPIKLTKRLIDVGGWKFVSSIVRHQRLGGAGGTSEIAY